MQNTETASDNDQAFRDLLKNYADLDLTVRKLYEWVPPAEDEPDAKWLQRIPQELDKIQETFRQVGLRTDCL
jgi:DNA-binding ferritin-like protein